jgi:tetratricopeptide (TPR) repeat protein
MCLGAAFWRFWQMRGHLGEGRRRLDTILGMPSAGATDDQRARALEADAGIAYWQADMEAAQAMYDENLALVRKTGDKRKIAMALYNNAFPKLVTRSEIPVMVATVREALAMYRELGDEPGIGRSLWAVGNGLRFQGDLRGAAEVLDEAIELDRRHDDRFSLGWALHTRALVAVQEKDAEAARRCIHEALTIFLDAGDVSGMTILLDDAAYYFELLGDRGAALRHAGAAAASQAATGAGLASLAGLDENRDWHSDVTSEDEVRAWSEGQATKVDEAAARALRELDAIRA